MDKPLVLKEDKHIITGQPVVEVRTADNKLIVCIYPKVTEDEDFDLAIYTDAEFNLVLNKADNELITTRRYFFQFKPATDE